MAIKKRVIKPVKPIKPIDNINIFYVSPSGRDSNNGSINYPWKTISKAAKSVKPGDTVYITKGVYYERVVLQNSGTINKRITFSNFENEEVIIDGKGINWGYNWDSLFELNGLSYITINGISVRNSRWAGIASYNDYPEQGSTGIIIRNCNISDTEASGIALYCCKDVIVDNNSIEKTNKTHGSQEALSISTVDGAIISNNHVFNVSNAIQGGGGEGIDIKTGSKHVKVFGNTINNVMKHGIYVDAYDKETYDIEVYNNTVYNCPSGITVATEETGGNLHDVIIKSNNINNCDWGIVIGGWDKGSIRKMSNIIFENNNLKDIKEFAFFIGNPDAKYITIRNNYLKCNPSFPSIYVDSNAYGGKPDISTYTIDGNHIIGVFKGCPTGINYKIIN